MITMVATNFKWATGQPLLRGELNNGLYCLPTPADNTTRSTALTGVQTSLLGWHKRLAHPHEPILRRLVSSFHLPISSNKFPTVCESCQLGKSR
ncbi:hypothetical protein LINPERHAP1_LOCUS27963, partial [Linum perenne]